MHVWTACPNEETPRNISVFVKCAMLKITNLKDLPRIRNYFARSSRAFASRCRAVSWIENGSALPQEEFIRPHNVQCSYVLIGLYGLRRFRMSSCLPRVSSTIPDPTDEPAENLKPRCSTSNHEFPISESPRIWKSSSPIQQTQCQSLKCSTTARDIEQQQMFINICFCSISYIKIRILMRMIWWK